MNNDTLIAEVVEQVAECLRVTKHKRAWARANKISDVARITAWIDGDPDQNLLARDAAFAYHWGRFIGICECLDVTPLQLLEEI